MKPVVLHDPMPPSPNRLTGPTCDPCRTIADCLYERICWTAERADIAAERRRP